MPPASCSATGCSTPSLNCPAYEPQARISAADRAGGCRAWACAASGCRAAAGRLRAPARAAPSGRTRAARRVGTLPRGRPVGVLRYTRAGLDQARLQAGTYLLRRGASPTRHRAECMRTYRTCESRATGSTRAGSTWLNSPHLAVIQRRNGQLRTVWRSHNQTGRELETVFRSPTGQSDSLVYRDAIPPARFWRSGFGQVGPRLYKCEVRAFWWVAGLRGRVVR